MIERLAGIALGTLVCAVASAQSLDDRVRELERRVEQLEKQGAQPASPAIAPPPPASAPTPAASAPTPPSGQPAASQQRENWRSLRLGMSESDVRSKLGAPSKINVTASYVRWEYPEQGSASFDFIGRLQVWSEPRWEQR